MIIPLPERAIPLVHPEMIIPTAIPDEEIKSAVIVDGSSPVANLDGPTRSLRRAQISPLPGVSIPLVYP